MRLDAWPIGWPPGASMPDASNRDIVGADVNAAETSWRERLRISLERVIGSQSLANDTILAAVSGGPDSLALLIGLDALMPGRVRAATVDHGLRPESAEEACFVARICAARDIEHKILSPADPITGNIQSSARAARYALLEADADDRQCHWIATAHHADDQLETVLMRLARSSGVAGLAGIRARSGRRIRPLLGFRKSALVAVCGDAGVSPIADPSNRDPAFDRVRMREALRAFDGIDPLAAVRSAEALADADEALDWVVTREFAQSVTCEPDAVLLDPSDYPRELRRRLVLRCLAVMEPSLVPRGATLDRLIDALERDQQAMVGDVLCKGGSHWRFAPAPARRFKHI